MSGLAGWTVLGERVAAAAIAATLLAGVVALVLRALPGLSPRLRAGLWWLVAARTLLELAGAPALELAWLPARAERPAARAPHEAAAPPIAGDATIWVAERSPSGGVEAATLLAPVAAPAAGADLGAVALAVLAAGWSLAAALAMGVAWRDRRRLVRRLASARPIDGADEPATLELLERLRAELGPARPVRLLRCARSVTPHAVGWRRPAIVLPAAELEPEELRLALAHELVHLRRADALRGLVPWLAERLFAAHPAVRWAAREYVLANECACDAEVLSRLGVAPARYGRLLLRFAAPPAGAPAAHGWALARRPIERRLVMLARSVERPPRGAWIAVGLLALLVACPLRLVGAVAADGWPEAPPAIARTAEPAPASETASPAEPAKPADPAESTAPAAREAVAPTFDSASPIADAESPVANADTPRPGEATMPLPDAETPVWDAGSPVHAPWRHAGPAASWTPRPPAVPRPPRPAHSVPAMRAPVPPIPAVPATPAVPAVARHARQAPLPQWPTLAPTPPVPPAPPAPAYAPMAPRPLLPIPPAPPVPRPLGLGRGTGLVLLDGDTRVRIDAEPEHLELAERSRRGGEPVLVLVRGGRTRVIHDRREIAEVVALLDAQARLAEGQAAVAEQAARRAEEIANRAATEWTSEIERRQREIATLQEELARHQRQIEIERGAESARALAELQRVQAESTREAERRALELERELQERVRRLVAPTEERTP